MLVDTDGLVTSRSTLARLEISLRAASVRTAWSNAAATPSASVARPLAVRLCRSTAQRSDSAVPCLAFCGDLLS